MTNAAVDQYLEEIKPFLKSHYSIASALKKFFAPTPQKPLAQLNGADIHQLVRHRLKTGIKPGTINRELSVVSAFINHARYKWGLTMENPTARQRLRMPSPRLRFLDRDEAIKLQKQADDLRPDLGDFVRLALNTGCRKNELLTLKWTDINLERSYILLRPENVKGAKRRVIPINNGARAALESRQYNNKTEWVFAKKDGKRVKALDWLFRKSVKQSGIQDFRIHDLRHTFASWLVSNGVDLIKVRDLLGHSSIKMTERYAHLMPNRLLAAVQVLDLFSEGGE